MHHADSIGKPITLLPGHYRLEGPQYHNTDIAPLGLVSEMLLQLQCCFTCWFFVNVHSQCMVLGKQAYLTAFWFLLPPLHMYATISWSSCICKHMLTAAFATSSGTNTKPSLGLTLNPSSRTHKMHHCCCKQNWQQPRLSMHPLICDWTAGCWRSSCSMAVKLPLGFPAKQASCPRAPSTTAFQLTDSQ